MVLLISIVGLLVALSVHEASHALAAKKFGDDTSSDRISLNPLKHIDIVGLLSLLFLGVGWGKPVYINPNNFSGTESQRERTEAKVALAGPLSNIVISFLLMLILVILERVGVISLYANSGIYDFVIGIIQINLGLGLFNLVPIPPLDGYKIIRPILTDGLKDFLDRNENIIQVILILLITTGVLRFNFLSNISRWLITNIARFCYFLVGIF